MHSPHPASLLLAALVISCQASEPSASPLTDGHAWTVTYQAEAYSGTWQDPVSVEDVPLGETGATKTRDGVIKRDNVGLGTGGLY